MGTLFEGILHGLYLMGLLAMVGTTIFCAVSLIKLIKKS